MDIIPFDLQKIVYAYLIQDKLHAVHAQLCLSTLAISRYISTNPLNNTIEIVVYKHYVDERFNKRVNVWYYTFNSTRSDPHKYL